RRAGRPADAGVEGATFGHTDARRGNTEGSAALCAVWEAVRRTVATRAPRGECRSALHTPLIQGEVHPAGPPCGGLPRTEGRSEPTHYRPVVRTLPTAEPCRGRRW